MPGSLGAQSKNKHVCFSVCIFSSFSAAPLYLFSSETCRAKRRAKIKVKKYIIYSCWYRFDFNLIWFNKFTHNHLQIGARLIDFYSSSINFFFSRSVEKRKYYFMKKESFTLIGFNWGKKLIWCKNQNKNNLKKTQLNYDMIVLLI